MTDEQRPPTTTTDSGIPVSRDEHSLTVGPNGPTVPAEDAEQLVLDPRAAGDAVPA